MFRLIPFFLLLFGLTSLCHAQQTIKLKNPSFEVTPRQGGYYTTVMGTERNKIEAWFDCGTIDFPDESAPDIHSSTTNYWSVNHVPSHGETFLSLSARDNDSWESVSQELETELQKDKCYVLTIDLSQSETFMSRSRLQKEQTKDFNYSKPLVLRVWGGNHQCERNGKFNLLYESTPVDHREWRTYDITLAPSSDIKYLMLEAFYKTPVIRPYNGHILVDNISEIVEVECQE